MDVFSLSDRIVADYGAFSRSFTPIRSPDIRPMSTRNTTAGAFGPEPLVQINPRYQSGGTIAQIVADGLLHPTPERSSSATERR